MAIADVRECKSLSHPGIAVGRLPDMGSNPATIIFKSSGLLVTLAGTDRLSRSCASLHTHEVLSASGPERELAVRLPAAAIASGRRTASRASLRNPTMAGGHGGV